jgi:hemerythrin-like domain-containing protein
MNSPIPHDSPLVPLAEDHAVALTKLVAVDQAASAIVACGTSSDTLAVLADFRAFLDGPITRHFQQEEIALFPPLEAVIGAQGGPTAVMRHEHQELYAAFDEWRRLAAEAARAPVGSTPASASELQRVSRQIGSYLGQHIHKEDNVLLPMCHRFLPAATLAEVGERMQAVPLPQPSPTEPSHQSNKE